MEEEAISRRARIIRDLVAEFNHNDFLKTKFREERRGISEFDKPFKYPDHLEATRYDLDNFSMEFLRRTDIASDWVLLQLHGGGYVGPMKQSYRTLAGLYCEVGNGISVLTIDYRVAPENPYPAALEDAEAAFDWLLERGYDEQHILLGGDSAGGGLALALCHKFIDDGRRLPAGIVAMSPWTDLTASGSSYTENFEIDPIFGNTEESLIYDNPYAAGCDLTDKYISPLFGELDGFPPMLIQVGSHEMLLSDSTQLAEKAKAAGVKVRLSVYEGMFHVFQMAAKFMPESMRAWAEVGKFIETVTESGESRAVRIALAQMEIAWEDKQKNLEKLERILAAAHEESVDILLCPEMTLTGFSMNTQKTAEEDHYTLTKAAELVERYGVSLGIGWVKRGQKKSENHYSIIEAKEKAGLLLDYIKLHPFSYAGEDEYFEGGDSACICELLGLKLGAVICYDLRFPEVFQILSEEAELIAVPANWPAKRRKHWLALLRARAIENQCYIAGVNCCGNMDGQVYSGDSCVFDPNGDLIEPCKTLKWDGVPGATNEKLQIYDIVNNVKKIRKGFPVKADRRISLYRELELKEKK